MKPIRHLGRAALAILAVAAAVFAQRPIAPDDLYRLPEVSGAQISPDGTQIAFVVQRMNRATNRYDSHLWIGPSTGGAEQELTSGDARDSTPRWSPDGTRLAFLSTRDGQSGLWIIQSTGGQPRLVTPIRHSNFFLTKAGASFAWSPDGKQLAFVGADPREKAAPTDPRVITRLQFKTRTSLSDDLHTHIFVVDAGSGTSSADDSRGGGTPRALTSGRFDEHSIDWSPDGRAIVFASNRQPDPDANHSYDLFTVEVATGQTRQLTHTKGSEYSPVWSPDGKWIAYTATTRDVTTIDSVAEDTHVWVVAAAGGPGKELNRTLDRRCASPAWAADSRSLYFLAGDHGRTLIYQVPADGGTSRALFEEPAQIGSLSVSARRLAFTRTDDLHPREVWTSQPDGTGRASLTKFTEPFLGAHLLSAPERIAFTGQDGTEVEGWLMKPVGLEARPRTGLEADASRGMKYPLLLSIHGGPHGMFGHSFSFDHQMYAGRGYGVLYINPRGSSGYGQKFSDGCVNNWGGDDYQDLMTGVDEVVKTREWVDSNRLGVLGGSYGGFMTNWVITQTQRFKVAVASASVSNLISFYATSLYQDLVHAEFGGQPWDHYDLLWKWSPMKYIKAVRTPTMFVHGEQDNDVHITQAEEMYEGLRRQGVEAEFVRYPREGHGIQEPAHRVDRATRMLTWLDAHLTTGAKTTEAR